MEDYKEFTGKSLDEAMAAACKFFGMERGKLEIEIISDAKSGIFGLVGAKKASVRARKANITPLELNVGGSREKDAKKAPAKTAKPRRDKETAAQPQPKSEAAAAPEDKADKNQAAKLDSESLSTPSQAEDKPSAQAAGKREAQARPAQDKNRKPRQPRAPRAADSAEAGLAQQDQHGEANDAVQGNADAADEKPRQQRGRQSARKSTQNDGKGDKRQNSKGRDSGKSDRNSKARPERVRQPRPEKPDTSDNNEERFPEVPLESIDQALLESEVLSVVDSITKHIVGEAGKEFEVSVGKVRVRIDSGEDSGLLIGRDGQTLSALQYLASCIVSRRLNASVRVQIDAGDYRNRQMEKLRSTALELAERVKENGKPQSTRPMSAYLRRVVHMTLQDDPDVQTHSKGDGSLKRVVIVPKKK